MSGTPDLEKVTNALAMCGKYGHVCIKCPYDGQLGCIVGLKSDALILLKKQADEIKKLKTQLDEAMLWR